MFSREIQNVSTAGRNRSALRNVGSWILESGLHASGQTCDSKSGRPVVTMNRMARSTLPARCQRSANATMSVFTSCHVSSVTRKIISAANIGSTASATRMACAATPWSASALLYRPAPLGVALPGLAAGPQRRGAGRASHRRPVASQRLPPLLAVAITPSGPAQDGHRDP